MTTTDWIGFGGVSTLLVAFSLNLLKLIAPESLLYILLNLSGAALACLASVLLNYWPFIILEGVWTFASFVALVRCLNK